MLLPLLLSSASPHAMTHLHPPSEIPPMVFAANETRKPKDAPPSDMERVLKALGDIESRLAAIEGGAKSLPVAVKTKCDVQAPPNSVAGWRIETYERGAEIGGLAGDNPLGVTPMSSLPMKLGVKTSLPQTNSLVGHLVRGSYIPCEEGLYTFALVVQPSADSVMCTTFVDVGGERFVAFKDLTIEADKGSRMFVSKPLRLQKAPVETRIWMDCAQRSFSGYTHATTIHKFQTNVWAATAFTLKVKPPNEDNLREFARGEVFRPR